MSLHAPPPPPLVPEPKDICYVTGKQLGKGGFAICHKAEVVENNEQTGKVVALKIVKSHMEPQKLAQKFVTELQLHSKLSHPNIVGFHRAFSFGESTYVVLEICENGSLADAIKKRKFFTMPEIRRWVIQTCGAVKYLHHRNIVHRDLKTGNLFLDRDMNIKVGDFGLAAVLVGKNDLGLRRTTMCGTPNYLAPEILEKSGKGHNEKVDLWAIGIIAYTLAVGKGPFYASKKEEIYKKLQSREYEWPDLSKHQNNISIDLQDLVSSLLVDEDDRPSPDEIVSHSFFKREFIPEHLDSSCVTNRPVWPMIMPPTSEVIRRGYSDGWWKLCKASGVGEYAPGRFFPLAGNTSAPSVVRDMEKEIKAGRAPSVPMAQGVVYTPFVTEAKAKNVKSNNLSDIAEEGESSAATPQLVEISGNDRLAKPVRKTGIRAASDRRYKENDETTGQDVAAPIRRAKSTKGRLEQINRRGVVDKVEADELAPGVERAATSLNLRKGAIRVVRPAASTRTRKASREQQPPEDIPIIRETAPISRAPASARAAAPENQVWASSRRNLVEVEGEERVMAGLRDYHRTQQRGVKLGPETESLAGKIKRTNITRTRKASKEEQKLEAALVTKSLAPSSKDEATRPKLIKNLSSNEPDLTRKFESKRQTPNDEFDKTKSHTASDASSKTFRSASLSELLLTDPSSVLNRATELHNNIARALGPKGRSLKCNSRRQDLPFVSQWVDYAKRHGIGYVLGNGTVGCLLTATSRYDLTHVVARNGIKHVDAIKEMNSARVSFDGVPLEFYVDCPPGGICPAEAQGEKKKAMSLMWIKFGRYMCQQLLGSGRDLDKPSNPNEQTLIVRFYQRLGTVGAWGFSDGCFQFNFPDHTKLVVSADGKYVSFTCLPAEAMEQLRQHQEVSFKYVRQRQAIEGAPADLLHRGGEATPMLEANMLRQKLAFVGDVVAQWIAGGGLGCRPDGAKRMLWKGPHLEDVKGTKLDWITLGRLGGDEHEVEEV